MLIVIVIICGLSIGTTLYIYTKVSEFDKVFAQGVVINEIPIGGLTRIEASSKIQEDLLQQAKDKYLILYKRDVTYKIPFASLGSDYNLEEVLDKAYQIGHEGNLFQKYHFLKNQTSEKYVFTLNHLYEKEKIREVLQSYASSFHKDPIDATMTRQDKQFVITPEIEGETLDLVATLDNVFTALETLPSTDIKVEVSVQKLPVQYTSDSFKAIQNVVASFTTSYNNSDANRNINLSVASNKINKLLLPGEVFSLAKQLEPIDYNAGYRSSKVIINGKLEDGIGGGICQIASTLYNALLLTDLEITMRQNHSLPVAYVPLGRDATYVTNAIDFQFKNNTDYPLFIESYCDKNKVYVNLFAHPSVKSPYEIKFDSVTTQVIAPPAPKYTEDPLLAAGKQVEELKALPGKRVKLYKLYYQNGVLITKELINNSYYRPRGASIKVGPPLATPVFNQEINNPVEEPVPAGEIPVIVVPEAEIPSTEIPQEEIPTEEIFSDEIIQ